MRDAKTIIEKRNKLRDEFSKIISKSKEIYDGRCFKELPKECREKVLYLDECRRRLLIQINALDYVLNEDTNLIDFLYGTNGESDTTLMVDALFKSKGVTMSSIFGEQL